MNSNLPSARGFGGFETAYTDVPSGARVFAYIRAQGTATLPVLILLHGFPQNATMFKDFIVHLSKDWRMFVPDLPGYGNSTKPIPADVSEAGSAHSKRAWAADVLAAVDSHFGAGCPVVFVGHDRGARVAYRAALDAPERVKGAALLDIVPTSHVWEAMRLDTGHKVTHSNSHWVFLASPRPLPETLIAGSPKFYFEYLFGAWTPTLPQPMQATSKMPEWVRDSIAPYLDPERGRGRIAAVCEDYRAGATIDVSHDRAANIDPLSPAQAAQPLFYCPLLVLSCADLRSSFPVDTVWSSLGREGMVRSVEIKQSGHFLVNERPEETAREVNEWLETWFGSKKS